MSAKGAGPKKVTSAGESPGRILVGPAGWAYSDWNGIVYPHRRPPGFREATYLAEFFDTIEINTSFYNPLRPEHAGQWLDRVAANPRFLFTAKLWKKFTHEDGANAQDEKTVREGFDALRDAVLLQFPFSFHNTRENLARLKKTLRTFNDYPLVIEVRHASWATSDFYDFLRANKTGTCNIDQPLIGRSIEPGEYATSSVGYVRLHGRRDDTWFNDDPEIPGYERYNYLYSGEELEPWAQRVRTVAGKTETTFVITNNSFEGKAVVNALELIHMLSGNPVKIPETLRHRYPHLETIADVPATEPTLFPLPPH